MVGRMNLCECFGWYFECSGNVWPSKGFVKRSRRDTIPLMKPAKPEEIQTRARASQSTQTATLAEIARQAGVSAPTVSKVLNGRADVAPATRTRVEELLREY